MASCPHVEQRCAVVSKLLAVDLHTLILDRDAALVGLRVLHMPQYLLLEILDRRPHRHFQGDALKLDSLDLFNRRAGLGGGVVRGAGGGSHHTLSCVPPADHAAGVARRSSARVNQIAIAVSVSALVPMSSSAVADVLARPRKVIFDVANVVRTGILYVVARRIYRGGAPLL
jgi:hypothetical protein